MDAEEIICRLKDVISESYIWPTIPKGWSLEFIAYSKDDVLMDLLHPVSKRFWSDDNDTVEPPTLKDGRMINVATLQDAGVPFMTTFGVAKVSKKESNPHLSLVGGATFNQVKAELEEKGTLAGAIERDQDGSWLGMIFEKNMEFTDPREQNHFAKCVFSGSARI